jgi:hypothetical protein
MPFFRNFIYWIDKRRWKYAFLVMALAMGGGWFKYLGREGRIHEYVNTWIHEYMST